MGTWFDNLTDEIDNFFDKATDEEIQTALDKANYSCYKNIDIPILEMNNGSETFAYKEFINVDLSHHSPATNFLNKEFNFDELFIADDNSFEYNTAA